MTNKPNTNNTTEKKPYNNQKKNFNNEKKPFNPKKKEFKVKDEVKQEQQQIKFEEKPSIDDITKVEKPKIEIKTNLIKEEDFKSVAEETLSTIASCLAKSVGPFGSTTLIEDSFSRHTFSKDGFTILKNMQFYGMSNTFHSLIARISGNLVKKVGDGTTSAVLTANNLYRRFRQTNLLSSLRPQLAKDILDLASRYITDEIRNEAIHDIDNSIIMKIASTSLNNDFKCGKIIADIFKEVGQFGFVTPEISSSSETYTELRKGYEIKRGLVDGRMVNYVDTGKAILSDSKVIMFDKRLSTPDIKKLAYVIEKVCFKEEKGLLIIAKGYENSVIDFFKFNLSQPNIAAKFNVAAIDFPSLEDFIERFKDIAALTQSTPINPENDTHEIFDLGYLGSAETVEVSNSTTIITPKLEYLAKENVKNRIDQIKAELRDHLEKDYFMPELLKKTYELKKRLAHFTGYNATVFIGGNTDEEKKYRYYLFEDAIAAVKSAIEHGYVLGGNLLIPYLIEKHKKTLVDSIFNDLKEHNLYSNINYSIINSVLKLISDAFKMTFGNILYNDQFLYSETQMNRIDIINRAVAENKIFNLMTKRFETLEETSVINSAEADIEILNACISIISLLITSNQLLTVDKLNR